MFSTHVCEEISATEEILVAVAMGLFLRCLCCMLVVILECASTEIWVAVRSEQQREAVGGCLLC